MDKYEEASRADKTITGKLYNTFMFANAATNVFGKVAAKSLGSALFPRNNRSATPAPAAAAAAAPASPGLTHSSQTQYMTILTSTAQITLCLQDATTTLEV